MAEPFKPSGNSSKHRVNYVHSPKQHLFEDIVRNDPSYTPNIEHLVFPERRNSNPGLGASKSSYSKISKAASTESHQKSNTKLFKTSSKNSAGDPRLVEVLTVNKPRSYYLGKLEKNSRSFPDGSEIKEKVQNDYRYHPNTGLVCDWRRSPGHQPGKGWARGKPVTIPQEISQGPETSVGVWQEQKRDSFGSVIKTGDMARNSNVSLLQMRNTSLPWDESLSMSSMQNKEPKKLSTQSSKTSFQHSKNSYSSLPSNRRREPLSIMLSGNSRASNSMDSDKNSYRELSPVRWCDREVDGVFLGRSGWVQVQQRSLDENRRNQRYHLLNPSEQTSLTKSSPTTVTTLCTSTAPTKNLVSRPGYEQRRPKLSDLQFTNSEPSRFSEERDRPAFLHIPLDISRKNYDSSSMVSSAFSRIPRSVSPSPLKDHPMSPPSLTPIISPPPAFQDKATTTTTITTTTPNTNTITTTTSTSSTNTTTTQCSNNTTKSFDSFLKVRSQSHRPPFLPRSDAIDSDILSPPISPPPPINWNTLPSPRSLPAPGTVVRSRRLTPSPVTSHSSDVLRHLSQSKSLEDSRRVIFSKKESPPSIISPIGFHSLDGNTIVRTTMPRLSETDSSVGGYEEDKLIESRTDNFLFNLTNPPHRGPNNDKEMISPLATRIRIQRSEQRLGTRRSPISENYNNRNNKNTPISQNKNGATSSSSSCSNSPCRTNANQNISSRRLVGRTSQPNISTTALPTTRTNFSHNYHTWDGRNRIRRSRSLQLPESKSPGTITPLNTLNPEYSDKTPLESIRLIHENSTNLNYENKMVVKLGPTVEKNLFHRRNVNSEEQTHDWPLEEKQISDTIYRKRKEDPTQPYFFRYPNDRELSDLNPPPSSQTGFNVYFVTRNKTKPLSQRSLPTPLQVSPSSSHSRILSREVTPSSLYWKMEPTNCITNPPDLWTPSEQRDFLETSSNSIRQSQSYPSTVGNHNPIHIRKRLENFEDKGRRSSPGSLERVDAYDLSSIRKNQDKNKRRNGTTSSHIQLQSRRGPSLPVTTEHLKAGLETSSSTSSSLDQDQLINNFGSNEHTKDVRKPVSNTPNRSDSNSSSSSDIWVTTSDQTESKSSRMFDFKNSKEIPSPLNDNSMDASLAENMSISNLLLRPGSAPTREGKARNFIEIQQRSLSLPKSFLSDHRQHSGPHRFSPLSWNKSKFFNNDKKIEKCNSGVDDVEMKSDLSYHAESSNTYKSLTPPNSTPRSSRNVFKKSKSFTYGLNQNYLIGGLRRSISEPLTLKELFPLVHRQIFENKNKYETRRQYKSNPYDCENRIPEIECQYSDPDSSVVSLIEQSKNYQQLTFGADSVTLAEALWDHILDDADVLEFRAGDLIDVHDTLDKDWWWGAKGNKYGWFPSTFVRILDHERLELKDRLTDIAPDNSGNESVGCKLSKRSSTSPLDNDEIRSSVVRELVNTERNFVKLLRDVVEGYLSECEQRADMFSHNQIETIFGNLEQLLHFQTYFLEELETNIDWEFPHRSCVGQTFLKHHAGFKIYSEYCNRHPLAVAILQELYEKENYSQFFESCRLMRDLLEIPLDGYLLTPVQRICKYPLQLAELLKYTKIDHPDYHIICEALAVMRDVVTLINERKRRMESLEKLAAWQQNIEGWEGEDLIELSTHLFHQGEVVRVTNGMWANTLTLFLFDRQLIYCKKDILKRNTYIYKGRIFLDTSEIIDVPDGKDMDQGVNVRHCFKVYNHDRDKWLLFCCRSSAEKQRWLSTMFEERHFVTQEQREGLELSTATRQLAKLLVSRTKSYSPRSPARHKGKSIQELKQEDFHSSLSSHHQSNTLLGRKVGMWFTTLGHSKKGRSLTRTSSHQPK